MKGIGLFCASQASVAIFHSMEEGSSSTATPVGGRAIDRHNPIIRDQRRSGCSGRGHVAAAAAPCSSQKTPISPKPYRKQKTRKSSVNVISNKKSSVEKQQSVKQIAKQSTKQSPRQSGEIWKYSCASKPSIVLSQYHKNASLRLSPPGSSRYLLSDEEPAFDVVADFDQALTLVPVKDGTSHHDAGDTKQDKESPASNAKASSPPHSDQVVVLRVALHCKGCAGKVRKHISRMQGVTSYSIDFAEKKVTVIGDVTPSDVLASISKVKTAQLWTPSGMPSRLPMSNGSNKIHL